MKSVLIAPSLLSADFAYLARDLAMLTEAGADWVHLDVMDGHFVPNLTFGPPVVEKLRTHSPLIFDAHLMVTNPDHYLEAFAHAGVNRLTVHWEACTHLHRTLSRIRQLGMKAGVSLNPAMPVSLLEDSLDDIDLILLMSVNPGFGGQQFIPQTVQKIKKCLHLIQDRPIMIQVDGGINPKTAKQACEAGATCLVAGSAVFNAPDPKMMIQQLKFCL